MLETKEDQPSASEKEKMQDNNAEGEELFFEVILPAVPAGHYILTTTVLDTRRHPMGLSPPRSGPPELKGLPSAVVPDGRQTG